MSASHNPAGIKEDWGIKFNYNSGEPAPERITDAIYTFTQNIDSLQEASIPDTDLATVGVSTYGDFEVGSAQSSVPSHCPLCVMKRVVILLRARSYVRHKHRLNLIFTGALSTGAFPGA